MLFYQYIHFRIDTQILNTTIVILQIRKELSEQFERKFKRRLQNHKYTSLCYWFWRKLQITHAVMYILAIIS